MNVKNLTNAELDMVEAMKFKQMPDMPEKDYDQLCNEVAKKIYIILLSHTDIEYPPEVLAEIEAKAKEIRERDLIVKVVDNDNPEE
jgi:hypothetical protein